MPHNKSMVGRRPRITFTITDYDGAATSPATFSVQVRKPDGSVATYTHPVGSIATPSTGVFQFTLPAAFDVPGVWVVEAQSTSPSTVETIVFNVGPQRIP